MQIPRIMVAAPGSGSGKTLITCGLLRALSETHRLAAFKCGPDYIDPMFHEKVLNIPSRNLDTFFTDEDTTRALFAAGAKDADFAVLEGVMGLYDGLGGVRKEGSSYHLAQVTDTPILLVVNARGMGRSVLPLIRGFLDYDTDKRIRAVLLNQTSADFYRIMKPLIEEECKIAVAGFLPRQKEIGFTERHLGLVLPEEQKNIGAQIDAIAGVMKQTVDLELVTKIAREAKKCNARELSVRQVGKNIKIGIAQDEAFCFYYADNLRLLQQAGAKLCPFSPLHDKHLPKGIQGLILGGGYPELHAAELSANRSMAEEVKAAICAGLPVIAECGGFMYLHEKLTDAQKNTYPMAGVFPAETFNVGKPVRFGYVELREKTPCFLPAGETIRGHEFHYFDSTDNGAAATAVKPVSGRSWDCVHVRPGQWMGYAHLYFPSNLSYLYRFLEYCKDAG